MDDKVQIKLLNDAIEAYMNGEILKAKDIAIEFISNITESETGKLTNGNMIKTLFPNYTYIGTCVIDKYGNILLHDINYHWWKASYKNAEIEDRND